MIERGLLNISKRGIVVLCGQPFAPVHQGAVARRQRALCLALIDGDEAIAEEAGHSFGQDSGQPMRRNPGDAKTPGVLITERQQQRFRRERQVSREIGWRNRVRHALAFQRKACSRRADACPSREGKFPAQIQGVLDAVSILLGADRRMNVRRPRQK